MRAEDGSMAVLMSGMVAAIAVLGVAVASVGVLYGARAQATTAADAAALAAAVATYPTTSRGEPAAAARSGAEANGAVVLACGCPVDSSLHPRVVEVVVGIRVSVLIFGEVTVRSASRAEFDPASWLGRR
jgi:peptidoglycan/LPS O-acetylase OafA/YrhL